MMIYFKSKILEWIIEYLINEVKADYVNLL